MMNSKFFLCISLLLSCGPGSASDFLNDLSRINLPENYEKKHQENKNSKEIVKGMSEKTSVPQKKNTSTAKEIKKLRAKIDELSRKNSLLSTQLNNSLPSSVSNQDEIIKQLKLQLDKKEKIASSLQSQVEILTKKNALLMAGMPKSDTRTSPNPIGEMNKPSVQAEKTYIMAPTIQSKDSGLTKRN
ncbi:hypothetical protein [Yokenella regensburgei]|uniref:hypothetical protein n=1 Tax=Yokenella regensburgei TaxID=158877 RepID=UPI0031DF5943